MDGYATDRQDQADRLRAEIEGRIDRRGLGDRLLARRAGGG
jgi:hypothetical protein